MNDAYRPLRFHRSVIAVIAGMIAIVVPSIATDALLTAAGIFPTPGQPMGDGRLLLALIYRTVYGIAGSYIAAWLAPERPMRHALVLGAIGFVLSLAGLVATWNQEPAYGPTWYPLALVVLAIPNAWAGGRLREARLPGAAAG